MKTKKSDFNKASLIALGGLISITLLSGAVLTSSISRADVEDNIAVTVPTSCTMSSTGTNSHTAQIVNGQYNSNIGESTITAFCNDVSGFAVYAVGYSGETLGNNKLTSSALDSTYDIATGTATSGNTSNWAMKLAAVTSPAPTYQITIAGSSADFQKEQGDPDYSTFQLVPDDYTKVAYRTAGTDTGANAEGSTFKTTYQAYISGSQPAGNYTGKVKYVLVHPNNAAAPTIPISPISIEDAYARASKQKYNGYYKMQDMSNSICSTVTLYDEPSQTQVIDTRDDKTYYIAKLQDGNCWMTQNLDHDIDVTYNYTNENTDIGYNTSTNSYDTASWTPVASTHATNDLEWGEYDADTNPDGGDVYHAESYDPGTIYWNGTAAYTTSEYDCIDSGGTWDSSDGDCNFIASTGNSHYHLGNYYNWTAAVAMNESGDGYADYTTIERSICPAGWTLPHLNTNEDILGTLWYNESYGILNEDSYNDSNNNGILDSDEIALWTAPFYFNASGLYEYGDYGTIGAFGSYWSSTVVDYNSYYARFDSYMNSSYTNNIDYRDYGYSVRCVAR